mmetsp:Transcript_10737/g.32870  ORF Transcript_10737/g.32870 Transcript_10737/m.32870 type:complete len:245 (-) Transcript_10737:263-997(-)
MAFLPQMFGLGRAAAGRTQRICRPSLRMAASAAGEASPNMFRARHILVASEDMANACKEQLQTGGDFGEVARSISQCASRQRGGDLGWFKSGTMVPDFESACSKANVGDIVTAKTEHGWHVIKLDGKASYPKNMSVEELAEIVRQPDLRAEYQLIDVRERGEVSTASIGEFDVLPMSEFERWADSVENGRRYDPAKPTVVMCHHGMRSAQMAYYLAQQGFKDVYNLSGGIDAWSNNVDPSVPRY